VPWQRPGFDIGLMIEDLIATNPEAKGVLLGHHGMSSWSNDDKTCYETGARDHRSRDGLHRAARPGARRRSAAGRYTPLAAARRHEILTQDHPGPSRTDLHEPPLRRHRSGRREDAAVREQRGRAAAGRARHVVPRSLPPYEDQAAVRRLEPESGDVASLVAMLPPALEQYRKDYAAYYENCKRADSPAMRDPTRRSC
jgi:rhamnose utilization protein RhaD (predicted bifunctional aldolase and dehydrogenase)